MKKRIYIAVVLLIFTLSCTVDKSKKQLTVVFYNVENLFDLKNEPGKKDGEFTPEGSKKWNEERYNKKLNAIARVVSSINKNDLPEIVGLCEVENNTVLKDLIQTDSLIAGNYKIVHHESPDFRGIDCALLYRPEEFKVLAHEAIKVKFNDDPDYVTRDILYVKGKTKNRKNLHVFVNHWPSRIGGLAKTEPKRVHVAEILKAKINSILEDDKMANIIVMGDMNDEPGNKSIVEILGAKSPSDQSANLINLMLPEKEKGKGSYSYRGNWNMLDNMIISNGLLRENGLVCTEEQGFVYSREWMEYKSQNGQVSPSRTYGGPNYYGGISDHFPVYFKLKLN